jgi:hypothetical protein
MKEQQTCGKGLAETSVLPAKLGELTDAVAEILEAHMEALDRTDQESREENDAYRELARTHRRIAMDLRETAGRMAGHRDLPMGRHFPEKTAAPRVREAFQKFVKLEQELAALLQMRMEADRKMLQAMGGAE